GRSAGRLLAALLIAGHVGLGCSARPSDEGQLAAVATSDFHERFNRGEYDEIWSQADDQFRSANRDEFLALMSDLHAQLGLVLNSDRRRWGIRTVLGTINGRYVEATYET